MTASFFITLFLTAWSCRNDNTIATAPPPQLQPADAMIVVEKKDTIAAKIPKTAIDSNSKVIYLTFDDGPLSPTPHVKQIIEEKEIKMSSFVVGLHAKSSKHFKEYLEELRRSPYIELCNHSFSHANHKYKYFYSNPTSSAKDIMDNEDLLGLNMKIVRLPGRCIWKTNTLEHGMKQSGGKTAQILHENGYRMFGWDYEWEHYSNTLPKQSPEKFVADIDLLFNYKSMRKPNHLVLLMHDEMLAKEKGRQDLRKIIDMLKERNYVFEFISHYPD
jgi:peptidoglycan/xylan/chitin deacetylase (PgdA/CDA1 family)